MRADGEAEDFGRSYWRSQSDVSGALAPLGSGLPAADQFRLLADNLPTLCWIARGDGYIVWYNRRWHQYCGTTSDQMEGWGWTEVHDPARLDAVMERWTRSIATGEPFEMTFPLRGADGVFRPFLTRIQPVRDASGTVARWFGVNTEISAQTQAEAALKTERRNRDELAATQTAVLEQLYEGVIVADRKGRIGFVSESAARLHGVKSLGVAPEKYSETYHLFTQDGRPYPPEELPLARAVRDGETVIDARWRIRRPDGSEILAIGTAKPVLLDGKNVGSVLTLRDDTERHAGEQALRESEARFRRIADSTPAPMWVTRPDRRRDFVNRAYVDFLGRSYEQAVDFDWRDIIHPDDSDRIVAESIAGEASLALFALEGRYRRGDGEWRWLRSISQPRFGAAGEHTGFIGVAHDVTESRQAEQALRELNDTLEERVGEEVARRAAAEEALRQAQKMEAVGQLTGGIAHDFNNLLTVVLGNIDMARRALDGGEDDGGARTARALTNAHTGAERAAALTQRLLAFARRQPLDPKPIGIDRLVAGMSDLLHRALGETVDLEVVTTPGLWRVEVDPNQLEATILNLAVNARDAMPRGGKLTIETANTRLDQAYAAQHAEVAAGSYVVIAVTDSGDGMSRDVLDRVFEPFFTTKEVGKGTGLGLSQVYGFVKQSGGHVKLYSEEGHGTTVRLYLPRLISDAKEQETVAEAPIEPGALHETLLVVEDDDDVRAYTVDLLRELGYRVLEAHDGPSALRLLERQETPVDLLFTDVVMPGMSGRELADAARELQNDLRVLYTSGYTRDAIVHGGRLDPGVEMIAKPFTYLSLSRKVRELLDAN